VSSTLRRISVIVMYHICFAFALPVSYSSSWYANSDCSRSTSTY